jgi:TonB dependent receptor-like, beta-barrel
VERLQQNIIQDFTVGGQFRFGSLPGFLTNQPIAFQTGNLPGTHTPRGLRQTIIGTYIQDDIRWRPNLTINAGLRYEMSTVPGEVQDKLSNLPTPTATAPHLGDPLFSNPTLKNFEPRVGFAWDPFRDGKTSVRAGFGMFDVLPLLYEYQLTQISMYPFAQQGRTSNLQQGDFPSGAFERLTASPSFRVCYIEPDPHRSYVMQWNFNIQRELMPSLTAMVAYVGSRGVHQLFRADDMNMVIPTLSPDGYLWPAPIGSGQVLNPNFGRIDHTTWGSNSFYDALQFQVLKKMSHGFQVQGAYTWSKSIDEGSGGMLGDPFGNSIPNMFWFDGRLRRGLSDFNIGQNLVINYTWNIPAPKSLQGATGWALGGWQLGGIFQASTGLPFTPIMGGDPLGINTDDYESPNHLATPGCQSGVNPGNPNSYINLNCFGLPLASSAIAAQCAPFAPGGTPIAGTCANLLGNAGRNSLIGPGLANFDFSLFKNNYIRRISENFNVQFRAEFFNVFNRANFLAPNDNNAIFDQSGAPIPGAGLIDGTSTTAREIQFALKLVW